MVIWVETKTDKGWEISNTIDLDGKTEADTVKILSRIGHVMVRANKANQDMRVTLEAEAT